ncbi:hypothetical protein BCR35DRAFT_319345 [Leucosporidium creatinivorum]|uniref:6-phosphogluconolactonase n=1 Tax=Leucosporidium creatinivorum TaxID=106004 RepID=A0A1Y2DMJ4_9BASI|nr:hypothetical protein BCR35DRAFT_319345 [Leucosporidium creatinivorum]
MQGMFAVELPPAPVLFTFPSMAESDDLSAAVGQFIVEAQTQSILRRGRFTVALSGGSMPKILAEALLGDDRVDWRRWEVFFADERLVPLDHPESTFSIYDKLIFSRVPIPAWQIHTIKALPELAEAQGAKKAAHKLAEDYEEQLSRSFPDCNGEDGIAGPPRFDLVLLGMGADGHCASLFPSHALLAERNYWVSPILDAPNPPSSRITFTLPVLSAARRLAFVCAGADKSLALGNALDSGLEEDDEQKVPAGRVILKGHPVVWFVDEEAARGVEYPRSEFWEE